MLELIDGRDQLTPIHIPRPKPIAPGGDPGKVVDDIIDSVRHRGDEAILEYTKRFDGVDLKATGIQVEPELIRRARSLVRPELIDALEVMTERLRITCERQLPASWTDRTVDSMVGELIRPLRRAGVYVPGGRAAYPSSVIMAAVPARVAGVGGIAVASPPGPRGEIAEPVLAACAIAGIDEVYRIGGAQAIAALAYGTETVRPVDKIVGPGNIYVTVAKRKVQGWCGIDSEAGPTEILIVSDGATDPEIISLDLIAQAEHGPNGTHVLVTWDEELASKVLETIELAIATHRRAEDVENALIEGGRIVLVRDLDHALETANAFAPEHLQLQFVGAESAVDRVRNAGSVFIGDYSPVPIGDYVGGTNHVLPTGGSARWASGLGADDFVKRIYVSSFERSALARLAPHIEALAETEGLDGHSAAVQARLAD